jgi:hypothetical protein
MELQIALPALPSAVWHQRLRGIVCGIVRRRLVYAGSRISAQLLCKNVTPIYRKSVSLLFIESPTLKEVGRLWHLLSPFVPDASMCA